MGTKETDATRITTEVNRAKENMGIAEQMAVRVTSSTRAQSLDPAVIHTGTFSDGHNLSLKLNG